MRAERDLMTSMNAGAPALGVEERSDEAPRAGTGQARRAPDPEVVARPTRRRFTAQYRLRILEEADRCTRPGEVGRLLRREGLYTSHLSAWRKARRNGSLQGLTPKKRGAKPVEPNPLSAKVRQLETKVARLEKELATAHTILEVQGNASRPPRPSCTGRNSSAGVDFRTAVGSDRPLGRLFSKRWWPREFLRKRLKAAAALLYRKKLQRGRRLSDGRGERPSTWSFVLQEVVAEGVS